MFSFVVPCTITFVELQYGLYQSIETDIVKRVTNILYRSPVVVQHPRIELYVEFEHIVAYEVQHDPDVQDDRVEAYLGMNDDSNEEFEATYEAGDEDEDGDAGGEAVAETLVVLAAVSQPMGVPPFMCSLDLDAMHAPEFPEYANIGLEWNTIQENQSLRQFGVTLSPEESIDYIVYESETQTFYRKCKNYGRGCDWLIRASLIQKKVCWEIQRYNWRHTCSMGMISQDHSKLDLDTIAEAMKPLVESDPSIQAKTTITGVQARFNYTISYRKAWLAK
ncbi:hypothetical protein Ahy_A02g008106 [Arachis hypogaea]|uniref:Transposase MuDR plant domain-containing protein n=1 Tax=Arachis hypogaea TaxID=3818 RepID=A0A445EDR7_ARAHY|nr:hypothetical protein Ahy_A02g008106 [Arachis hypogaea]